MIPIRRQVLLSALKLGDLTVMVVAFAIATLPVLGRNGSISVAEFLAMRVKLQNFLIFAGLLLVWHTLFSAFGLYTSRRLSRGLDEFVDVVKATTLGALSLGLAVLLFHIRMVTASSLVWFWFAGTLLLVLGRCILRWFLKQSRLRGRNLRHMLIVGSNARAVKFASALQSRPDLGYRVMGFADRKWDGLAHLGDSGFELVCGIDELPDFFRTHVVDEVLIALPVRSAHEEASRIAHLCEEQGILFRILPSLDLKTTRSWTEELGGHSLIAHHNGISEGWPLVVKRILDFSIALAACILLSPVLLLTALLIKLTSPGPVFFIQKRVGLNKRVFPIYKFRTMVADAEKRMLEVEHLNEVSGPVFKIKDDPRITRVGKFLRKTSIDELPQLLDVLKGDMSLVGPRPLPVRDYAGFSEDWQRRRFSVRPGITCLWQISGRSSISFENWMELDLRYIDEWSLWLDLQILLRTIPAVVRGTGAA